MMLLLNSPTFPPGSQRNDDRSVHDTDPAPGFPKGRLTSAAWEGWWHDDAA